MHIRLPLVISAFHVTRRFLLMRYVLASLTVLAVAGCGTDSTGPAGQAPVYLRVVNGLFQTHAGVTTAVPIDFLIDSATAEPSMLNIPSSSMSTGDSANGYRVTSSGVHSFVARRAGDVRLGSSAYTTTAGGTFLPRQAMLGGSYYTMIVAGVVPDSGPRPANAVMFAFVIDDPLPGPQIESTGVLQARFRFVNASATAGAVDVYVTPGTAIPPDPTGYYRTSTYIPLRYSTRYINANPGSYVISIVGYGTNTVIAQQAVTVTDGEVRSIILLGTAPGTPSPVNQTLISVLDHQY